MLFPEGSSLVVRLSDALKLSLDTLRQMSVNAIEEFEPYRDSIRALQRQAKAALAAGTEIAAAELSKIPTEVSQQAVVTQMRIHGQSLTAILMCCFTLEAYINALAHYLLSEHDVLGLIRDGHRTSADVLFEAIERMSVRDKWGTVARLGKSSGFDRSRSPWQEFDVLFKFRDDHVHDKVTPYSADRAAKRYHNRFPDPLGGCLDLGHALFASMTYWSMVLHVHDLVGVPKETFHRHYNLMPWLHPDALREMREVEERYRSCMQPKP